MDLSRVPGMSPEWKAALEAAGVATTAALARATGLPALAARTSIPQDRLEGLREAARRRVLSTLRRAGVEDERDLAQADAAALAARVEMTPEDVAWFQAAAREALAGLPPRRVTLRPGNALARVRLDDDVHEGVPLRTLDAGQEPGALLAGTDGNVVLLRAGEPTAATRVQGVVDEALPLYAESADGEVAVRVAALRVAQPEAARKEKRGLFGRRKPG